VNLGNKYKRRFGKIMEWSRKSRKEEDREKRSSDNARAIKEELENMPYYDYKCEECESEIEIQHSIKDDAVEHQPHVTPGVEAQPCDGKLTRLISKSTGFNFEGGSPTPNYHG